MTYLQAQRIYKKRHRKVVKTCWIADIKSKHGKTTRKAPNRIGKKPTKNGALMRLFIAL